MGDRKITSALMLFLTLSADRQHMYVRRHYDQRIIYASNRQGISSPKTFLTPQHHLPLDGLRGFSRTLIGSMLFSLIGGYCGSLNYNSSEHEETFVLNTRPAPLP